MTNRYRYNNIKIHRKNPEYLSEFAKNLLSSYYLRDGETVPQAYARAATAYCFGDYSLAQRIYDYVYNGWFMFASPILSNAPKGEWIPKEDDPGAHYWYNADFLPHEKIKGLPISCFAFEIPDTLNGQIDAIQEMAALSVSGGGTGAHNSIRATGGVAVGPIPYLKMLDSAVSYFRQGKTRKGAMAIYMNIDHPDIETFIRMRKPGGDPKVRSDNRQQFHNAVNLTDEFIDAVFNDGSIDLKCPHSKKVFDTLPARKLWEDILEIRALTGEPYLLKIDQANRKLPESQKRLGLEIRGSNLCVAPETKILTDKGHVEIASLEDQQVNVWNGEEWSAVTVRKTGEGKELIKVVLDSGQEIECTPEHHFYVQISGEEVKKSAKDLKIGEKLVPTTLPDGKSSYLSVQEIIQTGRISDTYCFTEPKRHMGVFNGVLTGQCSEILLPTNEERTFVCCLSSLNIEKYDEWKDTSIVSDLIRFLDNVLEYFIKNAPASLKKSVFSAERERAVGLGTFGWHSYLQSKMIPFESGGFNSAVQETHRIYGHIKTEALKASQELALERGEPADMIGTGLRNSRLMAIAPNANSADIIGASPSIEPWYRNFFLKDTRAGSFEVKNPHLERILEERGQNTKAVWRSIRENNGSVQHLDCLTPEEKAVFKTAMEMDQHWLVELAEARGPYVCQAQSLNLFFPARVDRAYVNSVHLKFLNSPNVHTLYYFRTEKETTANISSEITQERLKDWRDNSVECVACQG